MGIQYGRVENNAFASQMIKKRLRKIILRSVARGVRCRVSYSKGCAAHGRRVIIEVSVEWVRLLEALRALCVAPTASKGSAHTCTRTYTQLPPSPTVVPLAAWRLINYHLVIIVHALRTEPAAYLLFRRYIPRATQWTGR